MSWRTTVATVALLTMLNLALLPAAASSVSTGSPDSVSTGSPDSVSAGSRMAEPSGSPAPAPARARVPVLAFYYNWFDAGSWNRAKIDYPAVGRYSSDDPSVIRGQIEAAKGAGIDGFIVSWKSTTTNNRRLRLLMAIAGEEQFKLALIYQGLDFNRNPLPTDRVAADFIHFRDTLAQDPVFLRMNGKPLTIFSGSWAFNHDAVATVTTPVRDALLVLSTEKSVDGYRRLADVTDGDAYYWSSVDPETHPGYPDKLEAMSQAVHADGNIWIAPFSPGFDARLVGGTKSIDRKDGETLITQFRAAEQSSPDALGLISWNEFSENTHVEPSVQFGDRYLTVLRQLIRTDPRVEAAPAETDMGDSSSTLPGDGTELTTNIILLSLFLAGLFLVVGFLARLRRRRDRRPPGDNSAGSRQRGPANVA